MKSSRAPSKAGSRPAARGASVSPLELARTSRTGSFAPSVYLEGPSEALKAEVLSSVRRAWSEHEPDALPRVMRAAESGVEEILAIHQSASLFHPRELLLVLDIEDLGRSEKKVAALAAGLAGPAGESSLMLVESAAENPRKTLEPLRAACAVRVVAMPPDRRELLAWGALKLEEQAVTAEPGVLESLADAGEGDALVFFGELSRLASCAPAGRAITGEDAAQILRPALGAQMPEYLAAVAVGDARTAARRLGRLLAAGEGEGAILFALSNLVGGALGGWAKDKPNSEALRRRRGPADLMRAMDAVYRAESAWKRGRGEIVALLEQATRDVCGVS